VGRARQVLVELGTQLGRALLALLLQFVAPRCVLPGPRSSSVVRLSQLFRSSWARLLRVELAGRAGRDRVRMARCLSLRPPGTPYEAALSGTAALAVALVGGAVAALLIPRLIAPGQRLGGRLRFS